jgi:hypothetical protein
MVDGGIASTHRLAEMMDALRCRLRVAAYLLRCHFSALV